MRQTSHLFVTDFSTDWTRESGEVHALSQQRSLFVTTTRGWASQKSSVCATFSDV